MARGTTLANLLIQLKAELRDTQEANTVLDTEYTYALNKKQHDYANGYDWDFLKHRWDVTCVLNDRFKNFPTSDSRAQSATINFERPVWVERYYNSRWYELGYGITAEQLNARNSDLGQVLDPIQRWQMVSNKVNDTFVDQFEVWPIPASTQTVRFTAQRIVTELMTGTDKADLDDELLVYSVAADYLAFREMTNAPLVLKKSVDRLTKLRAGYPVDNKSVILGRRSAYEKDHFRLTPLVVVTGSS